MPDGDDGKVICVLSQSPRAYEYKTVLVHRVLVTFCVQDSRKAHETHTRYAQDRARRPSHNTTTLKPLKHATHTLMSLVHEKASSAPRVAEILVFSRNSLPTIFAPIRGRVAWVESEFHDISDALLQQCYVPLQEI